MLNLSTLLEDSASKYADKDAFAFIDTTLSYAQINDTANQVANGLKEKGIQPGDKVALSSINSPFFPIIYFGILKVGAVVVPLSVLLKTPEIAFHLADSDAKAYFCFVGLPALPMGEMGYAAFNESKKCEHFFMIMPELEMPASIEKLTTMGNLIAEQSPIFETVQTKEDDTALIIYTSGTTGHPKGAELTHSNLFINAMLSASMLDTKQTDTQLIVLPLFHVFAMTVLMNAGIYKGAKSVLVPKFIPKSIVGLMQKHKVSIFAGVPTMYWGLLNYKDDSFDFKTISENLRIAVSSGASLPVKVLEDFESRFNVDILEGYGMSEGSPTVTFNQFEFGRKAGSVGTPIWGVTVKLVDDNGDEVTDGEKGELIYRGHNVMKGYYNKPKITAKTLKNGWMHSGDIAIKDEDGFFFIVDRTKDMIIKGGLNVYPREIEEVMIKHEAVSLVAVIGIPHEKMGEEIKACVVLKEGCTVTERELIIWTREQIAAYKLPRIVEFMESLPMSATGKVLKKELRKV